MRISRLVPRGQAVHGAAGWGTIAGSQLLALWLLWRPGQQAGRSDGAVETAALLPTIAWVPFFLALSLPGTAAGLRAGGTSSGRPGRGRSCGASPRR